MNPHFALFPSSASTIAPEVDGITIGLLILSGIIMLLIFGLILFFGIRYRKGSTHNRKIDIRGSSLLEWGWTFATLGVFLALCAWGAIIYLKMHIAPPGAAEITVVGKQWMWKFQHADGHREINELHVPLGRPILLTMTSQDVIHSFYVPAFRIKQDVLPGRYTQTWFEANQEGEFHLLCTQYCGTMHAEMRGRVIVMPEDQYQRWLETSLSSAQFGKAQFEGQSMASKGGRLFTRLGCISCHGENPGIRAPSLAGLYGSTVGLSDGTTILADDNYIRESILNPGAKIVQGYQNIMPSFAGLVSEEELLNLIAYVKALQTTPQGQAPQGPSPSKAIPSPPPLRRSTQ